MDLRQIGAQHPRIKQVLDLVRNATPNPDRLFVAEGLWAHEVLLDAGVEIEALLWSPSGHPVVDGVAARVAEKAVRAYRISPRTLSRIAERDKPDGLVSIARMPCWDPALLRLGPHALVVVADAIEIPGNLGTLIRTMDACRADCLVLTNRRTRLTHPKVFRGSHGMSLRVPVIEFSVPDDAVAWLASHGFTVYLADTDEAVPYRQADYRGRVALVIGNERYGISRPWYDHGFGRICVPMLGVADSLNVSVSASIMLYEARAQQGPPVRA